jgi:outer membrane protein assembly factor BamB
MKILMRASEVENTRLHGSGFWQLCAVGVALVFLVQSSFSLAVTSKVIRHHSSEDFSKGKTKDAVVGSRGTIELGWSAQMLGAEFEGVWSINSIVVSGDAVYVGTSPNGGVYEYKNGKMTKIYSADLGGKAAGKATACDGNEPNEPNEPNTPACAKADKHLADEPNNPAAVKAEKHLANEHIFAMTTDKEERLLVGISGQRCALCRLEKGELKPLFEPNDANYIFAIKVDDEGGIYVATGPQGKVYRLDSSGRKPEVVYDSPEKNILSLAIGADGLLYAGSDGKGFVYKINPKTKQATVLYDSDQQEITALLLSEGDLYAAATSANIMRAETRFAARPPSGGRPEPSAADDEGPGGDEGGGIRLEVANTKEKPEEKPPEGKMPLVRPPKPTQASFVYKVSAEGFVTEVFSETAVFFCLAGDSKELLVGTGNSAQLYVVQPTSEEHKLVYENEQASQLTAVSVSGQDVYVGTSNPARMIKLSKGFAREGTYTSELVDAGQPAKWGKLQIEADVPQDCKILAACRSGNVKDINDPSFSQWTEPKEVTGPIELACPLGRFCQYKLVLQSKDGHTSPVVREVAVAGTVPNLAPRVESVTVSRLDAPGKTGTFKISYQVKDDNGDKLIYKIDFRKVGRPNWIEIEDAVEQDNFEWDGKTVADGRYEIKVTASDERSNTPQTKLTGSRVSDAIVVDNTGPIIKKFSVSKSGKTVTLKLKVADEYSVIGKVDYTIDSNAKWKGATPDDLVCDTTEEDFTLVLDDLKPGEHVVSVRISDDLGNTTHRSFEVSAENKSV